MESITLDPIEESLDAHNLNELIELWLATVAVAETTLATYRCKIAHFVDWWAIEGPARDWRLTRSALKAFEVHLRSVPAVRFPGALAYSSRHSTMRTLRQMFRWASVTNRTSKNYGEWVPWPDGSTAERKSATPEQLARLMLSASDSRYPLRNQAIIAFFIGTGCRLGEVAALKVADLELMADGAGTATVTGKRTKANRSGVRAVAFDAATGRYLVKYLDAQGLTAGPLWQNERGGKLKAPALYSMFKRCVKRAGLAENIKGCHDLRRAFATILGWQHPGSPAWADMIRRQLGHKHYAQTAAYTLIEVEDIRERIVSPLTLAKPLNG
jgi:site-specific recombinase XerD